MEEKPEDAIVTWLEDFMDRDENLFVGTRAQLQLKIRQAIAAEREACIADLHKIAEKWPDGPAVNGLIRGIGLLEAKRKK